MASLGTKCLGALQRSETNNSLKWPIILPNFYRYVPEVIFFCGKVRRRSLSIPCPPGDCSE